LWLFLDFCKKIRVANIREYEQSTVKALQEINEKKLEFETQRSRLQEQSVFFLRFFFTLTSLLPDQTMN